MSAVEPDVAYLVAPPTRRVFPVLQFLDQGHLLMRLALQLQMSFEHFLLPSQFDHTLPQRALFLVLLAELLDAVEVPEHVQPHPCSRQGHADPVFHRHEPDLVLRVRPHQRQDHDVALLSLIVIHRLHLHHLQPVLIHQDFLYQVHLLHVQGQHRNLILLVLVLHQILCEQADHLSLEHIRNA